MTIQSCLLKTLKYFALLCSKVNSAQKWFLVNVTGRIVNARDFDANGSSPSTVLLQL